MSLGDTFVHGLASGSVTLNRVKDDGYSAEYFARAADGLSEFRAKIRHSKTGSGYDRHNVEVKQDIYATDTVPAYYRKDYEVMERKASDLDVEGMNALSDWNIAATDANLLSLRDWQS